MSNRIKPETESSIIEVELVRDVALGWCMGDIDQGCAKSRRGTSVQDCVIVEVTQNPGLIGLSVRIDAPDVKLPDCGPFRSEMEGPDYICRRECGMYYNIQERGR